MKYRAPRKKKKQAKKLKAMNDAMVMTQAAIVTATNLAQLAIISATPYELLAVKSVRVVETVYDSAQAVSKVMQGIKHWTYFIPNYRAR